MNVRGRAVDVLVGSARGARDKLPRGRPTFRTIPCEGETTTVAGSFTWTLITEESVGRFFLEPRDIPLPAGP
jgi:hypothetical protein